MQQLVKRLWTEEDGQGLVEYALMVLFVVVAMWVAVKNSDVDDKLQAAWEDIGNNLDNPIP